MIAGIVLAGGRSRRMRRPKALLAAGDETFLERSVRILLAGGCDEVIVVLNTDDPKVSGLVISAGARSARGAGADTEQIESLRAGLRVLKPGTAAAVVLPVDYPLVQATTVRALVEAYAAREACIVRPLYQGRHGHPVLFASVLFDELLCAELAEGARTVVRAHADELEEVEVDDRGVLIDVNTPAEYEERLGEPG